MIQSPAMESVFGSMCGASGHVCTLMYVGECVSMVCLSHSGAEGESLGDLLPIIS